MVSVGPAARHEYDYVVQVCLLQDEHGGPVLVLRTGENLGVKLGGTGKLKNKQVRFRTDDLIELRMKVDDLNEAHDYFQRL